MRKNFPGFLSVLVIGSLVCSCSDVASQVFLSQAQEKALVLRSFDQKQLEQKYVAQDAIPVSDLKESELPETLKLFPYLQVAKMKKGAPEGDAKLPDGHSANLMYTSFTVAGQEIGALLDLGRKRCHFDWDGDGTYDFYKPVHQNDIGGQQVFYTREIRRSVGEVPILFWCVGLRGESMSVLYKVDRCMRGQVTFDDRTLDLILYDQNADGKYSTDDVVVVDLDHDGRFRPPGRGITRIPMKGPFNVTGTSFELASISADGSKLAFKKSDKVVSICQEPADGKKAPPLSGPDFEGNEVSLEDSKGKLRLLIFWSEF